MDALDFETVKKKIKGAMGADYDMGSNSRDTSGTKKGYSSQAADQQKSVLPS